MVDPGLCPTACEVNSLPFFLFQCILLNDQSIMIWQVILCTGGFNAAAGGERPHIALWAKVTVARLPFQWLRLKITWSVETVLM